jgi:hypothetical protein
LKLRPPVRTVWSITRCIFLPVSGIAITRNGVNPGDYAFGSSSSSSSTASAAWLPPLEAGTNWAWGLKYRGLFRCPVQHVPDPFAHVAPVIAELHLVKLLGGVVEQYLREMYIAKDIAFVS